MPRPRPRAVVRLRAKIETSVTWLINERARKVPMMAIPPTTRGREAATRLPNTRTSRAKVMGNAIDSARIRSFSTVSWISRKTSEAPPISTVIGTSLEEATRSRTESATASSSSSIRASTRAWEPSSLRSGGAAPSAQYEATSVTPSTWLSVEVSAMPASAVAGSSTSPPLAVTRMTTFGSPVSKICSSAAAARADSASGSSNPPPVSSGRLRRPAIRRCPRIPGWSPRPTTAVVRERHQVSPTSPFLLAGSPIT